MTNAFTYIGMAVSALAALAVACALVITVFASFSSRYSVRLRRYEVVDALFQSPRFEHGVHGDGDNVTLGRRFTFRGARRLAARTIGARIFDSYDCGFEVVRSGWSESENGFPGYRVHVWEAAELLGVADDGVTGPGRWDSAQRILIEANIPTTVDERGSEFVYDTRSVLALARKREVLGSGALQPAA